MKMDEEDFRKSLTKEQLEARGLLIPFKVYNFSVLERLNKYSTEYERTWDELINFAINRLLDDIDAVQSLRS